jgi:uncharacterized protein (DUF433 family)
MTVKLIEEKVVKTLRRLPLVKQQEALDFVEFLARQNELAAGVESTPGVAGGAACIAQTRIPVWLLVQARQLGSSEAEILRSFPVLTAEDLANAWAYYRANPESIEQEIVANETA